MEPSLDSMTDAQVGLLIRSLSIHRSSLVRKLERLGDNEADKKERVKVLDEIDTAAGALSLLQQVELQRIAHDHE